MQLRPLDAAQQADCIADTMRDAADILSAAHDDGIPVPADVLTKLVMAIAGAERLLADLRSGFYQGDIRAPTPYLGKPGDVIWRPING